ncbi:MAG: flagellar hook-length control protein FliK [Burkholderiaceae bacterium]|jgi:flagellar hook-length control protein FliK
MNTLPASINLDASVDRSGGPGNRPLARPPGAPDHAFGDLLDRATPQVPQGPASAKLPQAPQAPRVKSPQDDASTTSEPQSDAPDSARLGASPATTRPQEDTTTPTFGPTRPRGHAVEAPLDSAVVPPIASTTSGRAIAPAETAVTGDVAVDAVGTVSAAGPTRRLDRPPIATGQAEAARTGKVTASDASIDPGDAAASAPADALCADVAPQAERAQRAVAAHAAAAVPPADAAASAAAPSASAAGSALAARGDLLASAAGVSTAPTVEIAGSAMATVTVEPDLHSPAFAPAIGARVAVLVREGVREARMQVNPAGLGPVDVRIEVDRHLAARVELVAEQAPTRAALEQALPALAAALRDSGMTLAGGGVFGAARDAGTHDGGYRPGAHTQQPGTADAAGGDDGLAPDTVRIAAGAAAARGLVDLYA